MTVVRDGAARPSPAIAWQANRRAALEHSLFALLPVLVCGFIVYEMVHGHIVAVDFRHAYLAAARRVLSGTSPYLWTHAQIRGGEVFVYPAPSALIMVPFALLPSELGALLFSALCAAAALVTLRVLDVRDWRLYGLTLVLPWVVAGWQTGNLTLLLGLGIALVWRYRDHPAVAGVLVATLISLKPVTAPIALWLLVTRRFAGMAWAAAAGAVLNISAWGLLGFGEIRRYVHLSSSVTGTLERTGYGLISLTTHLGLGQSTGIFLELAAAGTFLVVMLIAGRRRDELSALTAAIMLMLVAWPLVWSHYFALLLVPIAIARPRLGRVWLLPLLLWGCAIRGAAEWEILLTWAVVAVTCCEVMARRVRTETLAC
jgi:hypothetical protein